MPRREDTQYTDTPAFFPSPGGNAGQPGDFFEGHALAWGADYTMLNICRDTLTSCTHYLYYIRPATEFSLFILVASRVIFDADGVSSRVGIPALSSTETRATARRGKRILLIMVLGEEKKRWLASDKARGKQSYIAVQKTSSGLVASSTLSKREVGGFTLIKSRGRGKRRRKSVPNGIGICNAMQGYAA